MTTAARRAALPNVLPGQLWRDKDKRMNGRILVVSRVEGDVAVCFYRARPSKETRIAVRELPKRFELWQFATMRTVEPCQQ